VPSPGALADANAQLALEVTRRQETENKLLAAYVTLEKNVAERTLELSEANARLEREIVEHRRTDQSLRYNETLLRRLHDGLEEHIAERTSELMKTISELEAFSYSISHDLRTPLRAINGYAAILREEHLDRLDPSARSLLERIEGNAARMAQLIDGLLDFARLGRVEFVNAQVDMATLARSVAAELAPEGARAQIVIGELPAATGDQMMLRQVFANLIGNALKFSSQKPNPSVTVGGEERGDERVYWVQDNGIGFDMAYVEKLFGVFSRLHRADEYPGVGVGLAIVRRIVSRHGGRAWATSIAGEGSTFYFALPASGAAAGAIAA